jgi:N-dimethylarginine dimethylaminohydrolase
VGDAEGVGRVTAQSDVGPLTRVAVLHVRDAWSEDAIRAQWRDLNFTAAPDLRKAVGEYDQFLDLIARSGAEIARMPAASATCGLDAVYVRDAAVVCDRGVILCSMGKPQRAGEPAAQEAALRAMGCPIVGTIRAPGRLEGGDVTWLDSRTVAVGRGYRTNDEGIRQLRALLGGAIDELIVVPLPHWRGPADVFHLMSIISPVDRDLAVVYSPLMPVAFRERLLEQGFALVEVPDDEFETMGANVLAVAPRRCVMLAGNPRTRAALERAGAEVFEYAGEEISVKGGGGPTCLTRPLARGPA